VAKAAADHVQKVIVRLAIGLPATVQTDRVQKAIVHPVKAKATVLSDHQQRNKLLSLSMA
jgi:hypothetical protein